VDGRGYFGGVVGNLRRTTQTITGERGRNSDLVNDQALYLLEEVSGGQLVYSRLVVHKGHLEWFDGEYLTFDIHQNKV